MKKKGTKIRRYGNIYGRGMGSGSWQIVVAMIAGVLLFGVIGWSLYTPIHSWIAGLGEERPAASSMAPGAFLTAAAGAGRLFLLCTGRSGRRFPFCRGLNRRRKGR